MTLASLVARKPIAAVTDSLAAESASGAPALKRSLSALDLVALGIGAIIGAGIFSATGSAVAGGGNHIGAGPALIISYLLTAIACGFAALCYAEFAALLPQSGSAYTYAYVTLGELCAWIIGWDLILEYAVGNIAVAVSWSGYFQHLLAGLGLHLPPWLVTDVHRGLATGAIRDAAPRLFGVPVLFNLPALGIVALLTVLLYIGVKESALFNKIMVAGKLLVILAFVGIGGFYMEPKHLRPFAPNGLTGVLSGAAVVFFSYIGFDAVSTVAEEARNPQRDMPLGMLGSLAVCTLLYMVVTVVLCGLLPWHQLGSDNALVDALAHKGIHWAAGVLAVGAVGAMTAVLLVFQLGQPRILYSMARDGLLPSCFQRIHPRFRTPSFGTVATGLFVGLPAAVLDINDALDLCNIGTLFAFALVSAGVLVLRYLEPDRPRPFRCPGVPLVPLCSIGACLLLMAYLPAVAWLRFGLWLLIGIVVYALFGWRNSRLRRPPEAAAASEA
ncbi:MAG: amino acid permease [Myxococcales bacterium]|nr:amino acid permease [Myxococcota bacterium]MDW8281347.1 amino acid permease [Myxococcales bacterium]